jgi:hypothetical protein
MNAGNTLDELEDRIRLLSDDEQLWLVERLLRHVRVNRRVKGPDVSQELEAMASDPDIQRELQEIQAEFAGTESDGLQED